MALKFKNNILTFSFLENKNSIIRKNFYTTE